MYEHASAEDLIQIFTDTVVLYRKKPVYVNKVDFDKGLIVYDLEDMKTKVGNINVEDPDFDFTPVPLGFCNHNKDALYVQRIPKRQYKQGLCKGNISALGITADASREGINSILTGKVRSLAHCIKGNYPSITSAIKMVVEGGCRSAAFARKLAIDENLSVYYKLDKIGVMDEETQKISFLRNMKHLKGIVHA